MRTWDAVSCGGITPLNFFQFDKDFGKITNAAMEFWKKESGRRYQPFFQLSLVMLMKLYRYSARDLRIGNDLHSCDQYKLIVPLVTGF